MNAEVRLSSETKVTISRSVYARAFGTETVLLEFGRGEYYGLDEIGTEIWRGLELGKTLGEIADALVQRYDVEKTTALTDVLNLVTNLRTQTLIETA